MNDELITVTGDGAILNPETAGKIADFERVAKEVKKKEDELKKAILAEMESKGIIKLDTDDLTISYVESFTKEALDSKALRDELPDIYDNYVKITPVKSSIRIRLKG